MDSLLLEASAVVADTITFLENSIDDDRIHSHTLRTAWMMTEFTFGAPGKKDTPSDSELSQSY